MNLKKNMDYDLVISSKADRHLHKISKKDKIALHELISGIKEIVEDPYNSKQLKHNYRGLRRKRRGKYRIIFEVFSEATHPLVLILKIGERANVYTR